MQRNPMAFDEKDKHLQAQNGAFAFCLGRLNALQENFNGVLNATSFPIRLSLFRRRRVIRLYETVELELPISVSQ